MNKFLLAPDGSFLLTREEFLQIAPAFTEDYYSNHEGAWHEYSNANHIFAGIILEMGMGKNLEAVLQELVFEKLGMKSSTIDLATLGAFETSGRLVKGYQISSDGNRAPVNSGNLTRDSTESASMGLRTTLNDLASFNRELLRTIGAKTNLTGAVEDPFQFFFGDVVSLAGFVSHPSKGDFQSETPTRHLFPQGYESTRLGEQQHSKKFGAPLKQKLMARTKEELIRGAITHKSGYIDGFSFIVIVFEDDREFLIILANSTGPFDVVHHISRYLLQRKLDLKPRIDSEKDAKNETDNCLKTLKELEERNLARMHQEHKLGNPGKVAGTYRHTKWNQQITIEPDGGVFFHGETKKSRTPMALTFLPDNVIRILIQGETLCIEGWSVWRNMDFVVAHRDGHDCLLHTEERNRFGEVEVVEHVYRKVHA